MTLKPSGLTQTEKRCWSGFRHRFIVIIIFPFIWKTMHAHFANYKAHHLQHWQLWYCTIEMKITAYFFTSVAKVNFCILLFCNDKRMMPIRIRAKSLQLIIASIFCWCLTSVQTLLFIDYSCWKCFASNNYNQSAPHCKLQSFLESRIC